MLLSFRKRFFVILSVCCFVATGVVGSPSVSASSGQTVRWTTFSQSIFTSSNSLLAAAGKLSMHAMEDTADGNTASVVILLADQADVGAAHDIKDWDARGWFVYNTLTEHAKATQVGLRSFL